MTGLITPQYRAMNAQLHAERPTFGAGGHRWAQRVAQIIARIGARSVVDYGCGKATLGPAVHRIWKDNNFAGDLPPIRLYDPAIEGLNILPGKSDLIVCTDVLEHIEPDCLPTVLDHLRQLTVKCLFAVIATRPAKKTLPDGRNAHLIIQPPEWWVGWLKTDFYVQSQIIDTEQGELIVEAVPREPF